MIDPTVLRQLCEQATPGPLSVVNDNEGMDHGPLWKVVSPDPSPDDEPYFEAIVHYGVKADADLYAAAREALPQLLDENAALRAKTEEMQRWIDHHNERADKAESRLAALRESGGKVVESGTHAPSDFCNPGVCPMCRVWDEFIALLRSDP